MTGKSLLQLAEQIVDSGHSKYVAGDSCPSCGYDGLWPDGREKAIATVLDMLTKAVNKA